jgi:transglutaminase-like putative cysteine protease
MLTCVGSMSIHVALHHRTSYRYERPVNLGPHTVRLRPAPHCRTRILAYSQKVRPAKHFINWQQDPQANYIARLMFPEKTSELEIEIDLIAEMVAQNPFDFFLEPYAEKWPFEYDETLREELLPYRKLLPGARVDELVAREVARTEQPTNDVLVGLNQKLEKLIE